MQAMMSQMCTSSDLPQVGSHIDNKINTVSEKVDKEATKAASMEEQAMQNNKRVGDIENKIEQQIQDLRRDMGNMKVQQNAPQHNARPPRRSTGATSTSSGASTSTTTSPAKEWMPRVIHFRGWSPFGSGSESQIPRAEAKALQQTISDAIQDDQIAERIRLIVPL